jgi:hypothetical protein
VPPAVSAEIAEPPVAAVRLALAARAVPLVKLKISASARLAARPLIVP